MNIFERSAYMIGRSRGYIQKGIEDVFSTSGAKPSLGDESAWHDPYYWGAALMEGRKPRTKADFIRAFQSWVYICTKLNAQSVASIPLRLYVTKQSKTLKYKTISTKAVDRNTLKFLASNTGLDRYFRKSEEIEEVTDHPFLDLMDSVNPYNNKRDLLELTSTFLDLTGESYWFLLPLKFGLPSQIYVISSQYMEPKFGKSLDKAIEAYVYKRGATELEIAPESIICFTYPNPNNIFTGFSCIRGIADAVYIQQQMDEFETAILENRAQLGGVITEKEIIAPATRERLKEQLKQKHEGAKKAGRMMWLPRGLEYDRSAMTPAELNFIEGRKLNMEVICLAFDIPPGALTSRDVNRTNADVADFRHAKNGILPRCRRIEEKLNEQLISRYDEKLFCAFDNPVPEDKEFLLKERESNVKMGAVSRDEVRSELGKEPRGGLADELLVDNRLMPITGETEEEQAAKFTKRVLDKVREVLE